ncbi:MAG: hypothetical protein M3170_01045 [Candidatus Dormibacteraeota bacterium]|nr:hypothetical protein [Candidatus Dormibacteraeota bacterium]
MLIVRPPGAVRPLGSKAVAGEAAVPFFMPRLLQLLEVEALDEAGEDGSSGRLPELTRAVVHRATSLLEGKGGRADGT